MKLQNLFNLLQDAQDVLSFFDNVTTTDQLVSRLDRLKRQSPEDFAECLDSLRFSISATLEDNLELGGPISSDDDDEEDIFEGLSLETRDEVENDSPNAPPSNPNPSPELPPGTDMPPSTTKPNS